MITLPGTALAPRDLEKLAQCGISRELAERALLRRVTSQEGGAIVGRNGGADYSGLVFPYIWPGEQSAREYRLRRDRPEPEQHDGKMRERNKYLSPPGRGNFLYFVPGTLPAWLADPSLPVVVTEGEKKTLALSEVGWYGLGDSADKPNFLPIGLPGVWNWRGTTGKAPGPDGERRDVKGPIADLARVQWANRRVIILFDTNVRANSAVQAARVELTKELRKRRAKVCWFAWPSDTPEQVNGVDDYLPIAGARRILQLIETAKPFQDAPRELKVWSLSELRKAEFTTAEPIIQDVLAEGENIALIGRPKAGKSRIAQQLTIDVSRGRSFLGHAVSRPRRVLVLDLENRPAGARSRFLKMSAPGPADEHVHIYAPETLAGNAVSLSTAAGVKCLEQMVTEIRPEVLIVDTWRLLLGGDENKTEVVVNGLKTLSRLREILPALGMILIHHVRKQQGENPPRLRIDPSAWIEAASGHYSFIGHVDACYGLERETDRDSGEEFIVFGGIARNAAPRTLLLEEDPETLLFRVGEGEEAARKIFTPAETSIWLRLSEHREFSFSEAAEWAGTKNRKAIVSTLRKAESVRLIERGLDKVYRTVRKNGTNETSQ